MGMTRMRVWDVTSSRSQVVEAPDDVQIGRLMVILVERMSLPLNSPDGQIMSYKLHHRRTGQQLLDKQTLAEAGVQARDELRLQPEITAGAWEGEAPAERLSVPERGLGRSLALPFQEHA